MHILKRYSQITLNLKNLVGLVQSGSYENSRICADFPIIPSFNPCQIRFGLDSALLTASLYEK